MTLGEAYQYAYTQTLRDTLLAGGGPQHPSYQWGFTGRQEPVLTHLYSDARLTLQSSRDGVYVVFTQEEQDVLAEVPLRAGTQTHLSLAAGQYVVKKHDTHSLSAAQISLSTGDDQILYDRQMVPVPLVRLARKGSLGDLRLLASVGQYSTGLGPRGLMQLVVGAELLQDDWLWGLRLIGSTGVEVHHELDTQTTYVGPVAHALYLFSLGPYLTFDIGPQAGLLFLQQHSQGHTPVRGMAGLVGAQEGARCDTGRNALFGAQLR